jgi:hypothetical protein
MYWTWCENLRFLADRAHYRRGVTRAEHWRTSLIVVPLYIQGRNFVGCLCVGRDMVNGLIGLADYQEDTPHFDDVTGSATVLEDDARVR